MGIIINAPQVLISTLKGTVIGTTVELSEDELTKDTFVQCLYQIFNKAIKTIVSEKDIIIKIEISNPEVKITSKFIDSIQTIIDSAFIVTTEMIKNHRKLLSINEDIKYIYETTKPNTSTTKERKNKRPNRKRKKKIMDKRR